MGTQMEGPAVDQSDGRRRRQPRLMDAAPQLKQAIAQALRSAFLAHQQRSQRPG